MTRQFREQKGSVARPIAHARRLSLMVAFIVPLLGGRAQDAQPTEYQIKAAFLYHFAQLVTWPTAAFEGPKAPLVIGVLGENPFGKYLEESVHGKSINDHPLVSRQVQTVAECAGCHILFISSSEKKRLEETIAALQGKNVLTVGEMDHFTESGGMIYLFREGTKIRFEINDTAARNAGLKISSKLLSLASSKSR